MDKTAFDLISALGSIGAFITSIGVFIGAVITIKKTAETIRFKTERLYGKEAEDRYAALGKTKILDNAVEVFGPFEYGGGDILTPRFELERFYFDRQTMPPEWKKLRKIIRFYYKENDQVMVRGWRL
jgi:hypothetical protein